MVGVRLVSEFGVVVRLASLEQRGVNFHNLLEAMEVEAPLDVNGELASFGPHFGQEAATEFARRLEALGLVVFDDFFVFAGDFPQWCGFRGSLRSADDRA